MLRVLCMMLGLLSYSATADIAVTFNVAGQIYTFDRPVRLATVLSIVEQKPTQYWANAAVYQLNAPELEQQRADILQQLAALIREQTKGCSEYRQLSALYQEIGSWQLMRRLKLIVDYDQARLNPALNPQFNTGEYYIRFKQRSQVIRLTGMVQQATALPFKTGLTVTDYIDSVDLTANAHRDIAYLLEPDGDAKKLGLAYWNHQAAANGQLRHQWFGYKRSSGGNDHPIKGSELWQAFITVSKNQSFGAITQFRQKELRLFEEFVLTLNGKDRCAHFHKHSGLITTSCSNL